MAALFSYIFYEIICGRHSQKCGCLLLLYNEKRKGVKIWERKGHPIESSVRRKN